MPFTFQRQKPPLPSGAGAGTGTGTAEPPDKRRRTGEPSPSQELPVPSVTDDDWGALDDGFELTEAQLEELDLMASQAISTEAPPPPATSASSFGKPFTMLNRNDHKTLIKPKIQTNVPYYTTSQTPMKFTSTTNSKTTCNSIIQKNDKSTIKKKNNNTNGNCDNNNLTKFLVNKNSSAVGKKDCVMSGVVTPGVTDTGILTSENEQLRSQIAALKESEYSREGEIKMLRQTLKQKEADLFKQKQNQVDVIDQQAKDHIQKQQDLEKELDKVKTQLQFKEQDLKKLEERLKADASASSSDHAHTAPGPAHSPRPRRQTQHRSPQKTRPENIFPTTQSFVGKRPSPVKVKVVTMTTCAQTDPVAMETAPIATTMKNKVKRSIISSNYSGMSGPVLVSKLQTETETGIYKLLELCQDSLTPDVLELRHVAESGIARLLSRPGSSEVKVTRPLSCDTAEAVTLLPLIGACLDNYCRLCSDKTPPSDQDRTLLAALDVLICLVSYSSDVRNAILITTEEGATAVKDAAAGPSRGNGKRCDPTCPSILEKLLSLLDKVSKHQNSWSSSVVQKIVTTLERLASQASKEQLQCFQPLVQLGILSDLMTPDLDSQLLLSVVRLVRDLVNCNNLLTRLCRRSDQCTFYCLYAAVQSNSSGEHQVALCEELVALVSRIVSQHKGGATFVQETGCFCADELPKALVLPLQQVLRQHIYGAECDGGGADDGRRLRVLRKGLMLMYHLSLRGVTPDHFHEVEIQYTGFINEMKRILCALPDIPDNEVMAVRYLWDFDEDSSHEENSGHMDCD